MNIYKTADMANMFGVHANTVRLYEKCGLIPETTRQGNGYRVFTDLHVEQFKLARTVLHVEVLQNGLRKQAVNIIKASAAGDYDAAAKLTADYLKQVDIEMKHAEEAIDITRRLLDSMEGLPKDAGQSSCYTRKETADLLGISIDTLRNWELNGLFTAKRQKNGYRIYTEEDMLRLKIIRSLRCANYSLSSILRMLNAVSENPDTNIRRIIDTPEADDDIITACDKLLTSLQEAKENALFAARQIEKMKSLA